MGIKRWELRLSSFYSHRAHCRAIGHALRMKLAAAWVALAKQLQCGQWELPQGKLKTINNLQLLQHFIMLERLFFTYTLQASLEAFLTQMSINVIWYQILKSTERKKEEYKEVISFLKRGYSVRNTAKLTSVSVSTVQRIKREFSI